VRRALVLAVAGLAVVVAVLPGATARTVRSGRTTASSSRSVAREQARSLLRSLSVPPGSTRSAVEPSGDGSVLAQPSAQPATPNLVDDHAWWAVPGTPRAAIAFVEAHRPAGSKLDSSADGNIAPDFHAIGFDWGPVVHLLWSRSLVVEVVRLTDGDTGLRADSEVVWITPRPATERIPSGVTSLRVGVTRGQQVLERSFTVTNVRPVRRIAALIDSLPAAQPGAFSCPSDFGIEVRLTFESVAGKPLAVAAANPDGCQEVALTIRGHRQPKLTSTPFPGSGLSGQAPLIAQLDAALGARLNADPH
jgi:hypothetical protein